MTDNTQTGATDKPEMTQQEHVAQDVKEDTTSGRRVLHLDLEELTDDQNEEQEGIFSGKDLAMAALEMLRDSVMKSTDTQALAEAAKAAMSAFDPEILSESLRSTTEYISELFKSIDVSGVAKTMLELKKYYDQIYSDLMPYLEKEVEQLHTDYPDTADLAADDLLSLALEFEDSTEEEIAENFKRVIQETAAEGEPPDLILMYWRECLNTAKSAWFNYIADKGEPEELQAEVEKMLPQLQSRLPKSHAMPINRLANELQHDDFINGGAFDLVVAGKGKKNEITSYVLATYEHSDGITMTGKPYTEYDRQVQDAVSSIWEYGDKSHIVTAEMVFRAMTHRTQTESPSPQQIGAVTKSLEKMRRIHITVDATEEMKKRKATVDGEPVTSCKFDDYLLSLRAVEVRAGGKTVKAYQIMAEPVLLTYARMTKQIATVPAKLLDIKKVDKNGKATSLSVSNSDARIAVKGYVLRRIAIMKNDRTAKRPKQSNIILFDSLFDETNTPQDSNAANIKKYTFQVLDYYTATGYIKGYTKRKKAGRGGGVDAVVIDI